MPNKISEVVKNVALVLFLGLSVVACSQVPPGSMNDPQEASNRKVHNFNKRFDTAVASPIASGYGKVVSTNTDSALSNFAAHLAIPGEIVNSALQLNFEDVVTNTIRFSFNSVFGIGGLYDFVGAAGMTQDVDTDFGETLHVWGVPEGRYVEIPVYGGTTERDAYGLVVDLALDPLRQIIPQATRKITFPAYVIDKIGDRHQYADVIDGILYDSEDSYITARSINLQNRRFELNGGVDIDALEDPYAE